MRLSTYLLASSLIMLATSAYAVDAMMCNVNTGNGKGAAVKGGVNCEGNPGAGVWSYTDIPSLYAQGWKVSAMSSHPINNNGSAITQFLMVRESAPGEQRK